MGDWVVKGVPPMPPLCPLSSSGGAGGWDGLPSRSMGRRGRRSGDRPMQRAAGAPGACLRVTSGPPFHHAAMVLPAQTRGKAACRGHCVMGCAQP